MTPLHNVPIPARFRDSLSEVVPWCLSTREIDPKQMYLFRDYLVEAGIGACDEYVAVAHAGHGVNSYAITYQSVIGPLALFAQELWGGAYMHDDAQGLLVDAMLFKCGALVATAEASTAAGQLIVVHSPFRQIGWCEWKPDRVDFDTAERWVARRRPFQGDALDAALVELERREDEARA